MELAVNSRIVLIHQFEGMGAIAIHETITIWNPPIRKEDRHLQNKGGRNI